MGLFSIHNINPLNDDPRSFLYCTEKGELIERHSAALKMAEEMPEPLSKNLKTFVKAHANVSSIRLDTTGYKPNKYLPEGWLCKEKEEEVKEEGKRDTHIKIMNEEGVKFGSYKKAAEFMKAAGKYTAEDIERLYLYPDGKKHVMLGVAEEWKTSEYLPQGWLCQVVKDGVHINIASSDTIREKFKSYKKAAEFMKSNPNKYSSEDVARLYLYPDGNQHLTPETEPDDWKPSEWLPKGWMGCPVKKESEKEISKWKKSSIKIKSPEGERFNSYSKATLHMREHPTRYSEEDIRKLQLYPNGKTREQRLEEASWSTSEYLPEGWRCKTNKFQLQIQNPEGKLFHSYRSLVQFLKADSKYTEEDEKKALLYPDGKKHELEAVREAMIPSKVIGPPSWRSPNMHPSMQIKRVPGPQILPRPGVPGPGVRVVPGPPPSQTRPQNLPPSHPQYSHPGIQFLSSKVQTQPKTAPGPKMLNPQEGQRVKRAYVKKVQNAPGPVNNLPPGMSLTQSQTAPGMKIKKNKVVSTDFFIFPTHEYQFDL